MCNPASFLASITPLPIQLFSSESWQSGSSRWSKSKETITTNQSSSPDVYLNFTKGLCSFTPNEVRNLFWDDLVLGKVPFQTPIIRGLPKVLKKKNVYSFSYYLFVLWCKSLHPPYPWSAVLCQQVHKLQGWIHISTSPLHSTDSALGSVYFSPTKFLISCVLE